ncbi:P1 family peptidase [Adlercreutzia faecimuris]|uniref:P1 family peptidase n=1 Tax=Adlercreutzia faecimuris TaxID=2897341 RepID=A0ABS9WI74_9ACTN|nr:P1 family peptidase [Adlercreutzia sp. JBNU-10]MCI2242578.1 P1 family peptidase [Adlercreutzia sp. JBNU-10]
MLFAATLADLPAFRIGHAQDEAAGTGCTAVIAPAGATCGVAVRGGGPATRETDLLKPENMIEAVHAVVLSGGSAFGLEASCGVMDALAERGIGFSLGPACVPIVTGACLFDLLVGAPTHPDKAMGRAAAEAALDAGYDGAALPQGNVGAGTGATVGKLGAPEAAMKSGLGVSALRAGDVVTAAVVAVNALGHVRAADGTWLAGTRGADGAVMDPLAAFAQAAAAQAAAAGAPVANTTIGCVLTNARLTKAQATKVASVAHDAYARAIKPVHTMNDGDTVFAFASGEVEAPVDVVGVMATEAMEQAIRNAVLAAEGAFGLPAARDLR